MTNSEIPTDLEEAARKYQEGVPVDTRIHYCGADEDVYFANRIVDAVIFGAKWQAERLLSGRPLPEDTVLFNKGVEEGKRLAEMEQADLFTIVALDAAERAKQQMLKEAVEAKVIESFNPVTTIGEPTMHGCTIIYEDENKPYLIAGDKVRIIIVKED